MSSSQNLGLTAQQRRRTRIGLVAGGLGAYWPQFPDLLPTLQRSAQRVTERFQGLEADVVDAGFISDAGEARTDFDLDSIAYYHRGLEGELHERLAAGMILGASLLTARGVPAAGEYELRTSVAMLAAQAIGPGGSFTEIQALNFDDAVVEMGHDGPGHLVLSARKPMLRGLGIYHGKRGTGSASSSMWPPAR